MNIRNVEPEGPITAAAKGYRYWWVAELHGDYFFRDCGAPDTGEAIVSFCIVIGF